MEGVYFAICVWAFAFISFQVWHELLKELPRQPWLTARASASIGSPVFMLGAMLDYKDQGHDLTSRMLPPSLSPIFMSPIMSQTKWGLCENMSTRFMAKKFPTVSPNTLEGVSHIPTNCLHRRYTLLSLTHAPLIYSSKVNATTWWQAGKRSGFSKELVEIALVHLSAAASSCDVERLFSKLNLVLGQKRQRLTSSKLSKLALTHSLLKTEDSESSANESESSEEENN